MARAQMAIRATATTSQLHKGTRIGSMASCSSSVITSFSVLVGVLTHGDGSAHARLVAGQWGAVDAAVAVHAGFAGAGLAVALEHEPGQAGVGPQLGAGENLDLGVVGRPPAGLPVDAVDEHTGEQEVGDDGDALGPQAAAALQGGGH